MKTLRTEVADFVFHSFIQAIYIASLQVHHYSEALPTQHGYGSQSFMPKRHRQLRVKDLRKVPTRRLERDSNSQPFGRKAMNLPMNHQILQFSITLQCS